MSFMTLFRAGIKNAKFVKFNGLLILMGLQYSTKDYSEPLTLISVASISNSTGTSIKTCYQQSRKTTQHPRLEDNTCHRDLGVRSVFGRTYGAW